MQIDIANLTLNLSRDQISWVDICSLITSVTLICITLFTYLLYKKVYLNDTLLREEHRVLLEFKNAYTAAQNSIFWFLYDLLNREHSYGFHTEQVPTIKRSELIEHYNKINILNNLYNDYQYIFRKYKIESDIKLLTCFLDIARFLPENDMVSVLNSPAYQKQDDIEKYVYPQILANIWVFITSAHHILYPVEFPKKFTDFLILDQKKKIEISRKRFEEDLKSMSTYKNDEDYEKIKNEVATRLNLLSFKLDNLCMFPMRKIPKNLQVREKRYYPKLTK